MFTVAAITPYSLSAEFKFKNRPDRAIGNFCTYFLNQTENSVRISRLPPKIKHYTDAKSYSIFRKQKNARTDLEKDRVEIP